MMDSRDDWNEGIVSRDAARTQLYADNGLEGRSVGSCQPTKSQERTFCKIEVAELGNGPTFKVRWTY